MNVRVKFSAAAGKAKDAAIVKLSAEMNQVAGLEPGDMVTISETVGRMMGFATGRAAGPDSRVDVDLMVARTKEGRRFTWTCQIEVDPAVQGRAGDPANRV
jgi:hypothetical protein